MVGSPEFVASLGWHDEHAPRAVMQTTPDGDYTQFGVLFNQLGYANSVHSQHVKAPREIRVYITSGHPLHRASSFLSLG